MCIQPREFPAGATSLIHKQVSSEVEPLNFAFNSRGPTTSMNYTIDIVPCTTFYTGVPVPEIRFQVENARAGRGLGFTDTIGTDLLGRRDYSQEHSIL